MIIVYFLELYGYVVTFTDLLEIFSIILITVFTVINFKYIDNVCLFLSLARSLWCICDTNISHSPSKPPENILSQVLMVVVQTEQLK